MSKKPPPQGTQLTANAIDSTEGLEAVVVSGQDDSVPGLRWSLSEDARQTLRRIDDNIRAAEQISGHLTVG